MSQRCPVCKTRLWTDPLLTPGRLSCPRCGTIFRPTVPWAYFRFLLLVVVTLALLVIFSFSDSNIWILLFLIGVAIFFWFLPRFIDLQRISGELGLPEGPMDTEKLKLKLGDDDWEKRHEEFEERSRFRQLVYLLMVITVTLLILFLASLIR